MGHPKGDAQEGHEGQLGACEWWWGALWWWGQQASAPDGCCDSCTCLIYVGGWWASRVRWLGGRAGGEQEAVQLAAAEPLAGWQ